MTNALLDLSGFNMVNNFTAIEFEPFESIWTIWTILTEENIAVYEHSLEYMSSFVRWLGLAMNLREM